MAATAGRIRHGDDTPVFVISVAAELAGLHAQTLRQYDRLGLVTPSRTRGGGRRYSARDIDLLRRVQRLSQQEGISLAGIQRILELAGQVRALRARIQQLAAENARLKAARHRGPRVFAAGRSGTVVPVPAGGRPPPRRAHPPARHGPPGAVAARQT
jgi:MerR family transcriptional regulator/heat shock protein HspR